MTHTHSDAEYERLKGKAQCAGRDAGRSGASWVGVDSPEDALETLRLGRDQLDRTGKTATLDERYNRPPDLSGEFAGDPDDIWEEIGEAPPDDEDAFAEEDAELAAIWIDAATSAFYEAIDAQAADYLRNWIDS
jgi:hypothetical protein